MKGVRRHQGDRRLCHPPITKRGDPFPPRTRTTGAEDRLLCHRPRPRPRPTVTGLFHRRFAAASLDFPQIPPAPKFRTLTLTRPHLLHLRRGITRWRLTSAESNQRNPLPPSAARRGPLPREVILATGTTRPCLTPSTTTGMSAIGIARRRKKKTTKKKPWRVQLQTAFFLYTGHLFDLIGFVHSCPRLA